MIIDKKFLEINKNYYKYIEDYDWVEVSDNLRGFEAVFHKAREWLIIRTIKKYGRGDSYLDAGCGTGFILRHLPKGSTGIDINPRNVKRAKIHAPFAKVIEGDIEKLPFKSSQFSTVVCTEVLEHLPDPAVAILELKRVLKKGGIMIGSVPSRSPIWFLRFLSSTCPRGEPYHKNYIKEEVELLFNNFRVKKISKSVLGMSYFFVLEKFK